jgi:signal transduction histidine kinase
MGRSTGLDIVGPKAYVGRPQGYLIASLAIVAIAVVYLVDVNSVTSATIGALSILTVLATAWLVDGRLTTIVTGVAVASRLLAASQGAISPLTGASQALVLPVVAVVSHLGASGLYSARLVANHERAVHDLSFLVTTSQAIAGSLDLDEILRAATEAVAHVVRRGVAGSSSRAAFHELIDGDHLRIAYDLDDAGSQFASGEYPINWNRAAVRAVRRGAIELVHEGDLAPELAALADKDGWLAGALVPVHGGGRLQGLLIATARDHDNFTDDELHLIEVIAQMTGLAIGHAATFEREREEAERAGRLERTKSEFLRLASHEMRGPLTVVAGYLSMLLDGSLGATDETAKVTLRTVQGKVAEMETLISQMLEAARLEDFSLLLKMESFDLGDAIAEAIRRATPIPELKRVKFERTEPGLLIKADHERVLTILGNLVSNAVKYSPEGGDVVVSASSDDGQVVVKVLDHGIGIAAKDIPFLFTRFGRVVPAEHAAIPGTGLGLYLSRELARLLAGDVTVESELGRGSTFTLRLPLAA